MESKLDFFLTPEALAENEWIAGIPRKKLMSRFPELPFSGLLEINESELVDFLQDNLEFKPRSEELERDESFEQLITYFIIRNKEGKIFLSQRKAKGGEARAHGKNLIGFGGHLRKEDIKGKMSEWLEREFEAEVKVGSVESIKFLGLFNDDSDELHGVNRVHFGIVFEMIVSGEVEIVESDKFEDGRFVDPVDLFEVENNLETWSRVIVRQIYL